MSCGRTWDKREGGVLVLICDSPGCATRHRVEENPRVSAESNLTHLFVSSEYAGWQVECGGSDLDMCPDHWHVECCLCGRSADGSRSGLERDGWRMLTPRDASGRCAECDARVRRRATWGDDVVMEARRPVILGGGRA